MLQRAERGCADRLLIQWPVWILRGHARSHRVIAIFRTAVNRVGAGVPANASRCGTGLPGH
ncbi:hypothetical protein PRJ_0297 [Pseudomonas sp. XWY-1]|nr:hypothetical protein PRJ_0297 [Pseudomonas sp. XWY-1]